MHASADDDDGDGSPLRGEDHDERITRNWAELLQELRVAQTGIQLLTGFLVTIPFTEGFRSLDDFQRGTYLLVLAGAVLTTALCLAPVAYHRVLFRRHRRDWLVEAANTVARAGLLMVAVTTSGVLFLIFDVVAGRPWAIAAAGAGVGLFALLWFAVPEVAGKRSASARAAGSEGD
jgi:uncharacterized protein DUF6328